VGSAGTDCHVDFTQMDDRPTNKKDAEQFREFAAECRRMARTAVDRDRMVLMEIAEAWSLCAEEAEKNGKRNRQL
jgi:hypothetical protein